MGDGQTRRLYGGGGIDAQFASQRGYMMDPFDGLLSFRDAADQWHIDDSTLRKAVNSGKIIENKDAKKFGKQWIITAEAMERIFGKRPE